MPDAPRRIEFDGHVYDCDAQGVFHGDEFRPLEPIPLGILGLLLLNAPDFVSHDAILKAIWGPHPAVGPGSIATAITAIRTAISPIQVKNARGKGYALRVSTVQGSREESPAEKQDRAEERREEAEAETLRPDPMLRQTGWTGLLPRIGIFVARRFQKLDVRLNPRFLWKAVKDGYNLDDWDLLWLLPYIFLLVCSYIFALRMTLLPWAKVSLSTCYAQAVFLKWLFKDRRFVALRIVSFLIGAPLITVVLFAGALGAFLGDDPYKGREMRVAVRPAEGVGTSDDAIARYA